MVSLGYFCTGNTMVESDFNFWDSRHVFGHVFVRGGTCVVRKYQVLRITQYQIQRAESFCMASFGGFSVQTTSKSNSTPKIDIICTFLYHFVQNSKSVVFRRKLLRNRSLSRGIPGRYHHFEGRFGKSIICCPSHIFSGSIQVSM